jgi:alkylation response protein AidB-like acyl-CoA dehydrogenase
MYDLHLSPEQLEFRDIVRDFVNDEVTPVTLKAERLDHCDRGLPLDVLHKASQMGLRTLALAEDWACQADALTAASSPGTGGGRRRCRRRPDGDFGAWKAVVCRHDAAAARAPPAVIPGG